MATTPGQTGGKAATAITDATRSLSATIESLNKTLRTLNVNFDAVNDTADEVEKANKKHHKNLERMQKLNVASAESLRKLVQQQQEATALLQKNHKMDESAYKAHLEQISARTKQIREQTKQVGENTRELIDDHQQNLKLARENREEERKLALNSKRTLNDLASGVTSANSAFNSISGELGRVQTLLADRIKAADAAVAEKSTGELDVINSEIEELSEQFAKLSDKSVEVAAEYERTSTLLRERMTGSIDSVVAAQVEAAIAANTDHDLRISMMDAMVDANSSWLSQQTEAATRQQQLDAVAEQNDIQLFLNQRKLSKTMNELTAQITESSFALEELQAQYEEAKQTNNIEEVEMLGAAIVATTRQVHQHREKLAAAQGEHINTTAVLDTRMNLLGRVTEFLGSKLKDLATGALIGKAAFDMYTDLQWQSTHGVASSVSELFVNYMDAAMSGISSRVYQEVLAASRTSQLTSQSQKVFRDALESSTDQMFQFTMNRDEAARIAGDMYEAMSKSGISADKAKQGFDSLVPVMGRFSRATGRSIQEIAKMTAALYEDNDFRLGMIGLQDHEKQQRVQAILQSEEQLMVNGYTLEQAREMSRAAARRDLNSTLGGRVKTAATLDQMMAMISSMDPAQAGKWTARREEMAGIRTQLQDKTLPDEERRRLQGEIKRLEQLTTTELQSAATEGSQRYENVDAGMARNYESIRDRLKSEIETSGDQALINTGKKRSAAGAAEVAEGSEGAGSGWFGSMISKMQSIYAAGTSSPVVFIASVITALVSSKVLSGFASKLPGLGGGGKLGKLGDLLDVGKSKAGGVLSWLTEAAKNPTVRGAVGKGALGAAVGVVGSMASGYVADQGHTKTAAGLDVLTSAGSGAAMGAMIGTAVPIIGNAVGAVVGGLAGGAYGLYDNWGRLTGDSGGSKPSDIVSKSGAPSPSAVLDAPSSGSQVKAEQQEVYFKTMADQLTKLVVAQNQLLPDQLKLIKKQLEQLEGSVDTALSKLGSKFPPFTTPAVG